MGEVSVRAGDLESFAKFVEKELADNWNDKDFSDAIRLDKSKEAGDGSYPKLGGFSAATSLATKYETAHDNMTKAAGQIYEILQGLAEASRDIAKQYRTSEALAGASVAEVDKALAENVNVNDPTAPDTGDGSTPPTDDGSGQE